MTPTPARPGFAGWGLMVLLHASMLTLGACGAKEYPGRAASSSTTPASHTSTGDVALPTVAARGAAWLPPGASDGDWRMPSRDYAGTRYSPLAEITRDNAAQLELAWTFDDGESH